MNATHLTLLTVHREAPEFLASIRGHATKRVESIKNLPLIHLGGKRPKQWQRRHTRDSVVAVYTFELKALREIKHAERSRRGSVIIFVGHALRRR